MQSGCGPSARLGNLLAKVPKQQGARGIGRKVDCPEGSPLSELGISHKQSSQWQKSRRDVAQAKLAGELGIANSGIANCERDACRPGDGG
jgi:hypothetical protein